ncbi:MAG: aminoacyl-tRNA hydrolase [Candidatus Paceibacterota bacterium]|jgi:PTH1 family peptidyl-tRNA hydrolase
MFIIVGLGNPGTEYEGTRHSAGRSALISFAKKNGFSDWKEDGKLKALVATGKLGKEKVTFLLPNNFMNNSGKSVAPLITSKKKVGDLIVFHDDLDIAVGKMKISFNKSSGGHRGLESIIKNIKSQEFLRFRIGICPHSPTGKLKKPAGEEAILDFLMKKFKDPEILELKKVFKKAGEGLEVAVNESKDKAMSQYN